MYNFTSKRLLNLSLFTIIVMLVPLHSGIAALWGYLSSTPGQATASVNKALKSAEASKMVVATDYPSLQAAIDAAKAAKGEGVVYIPAGRYEITKTLDLTNIYGNWGGERGAIKLIGAGPRTILVGKTKGKPILDLTSSGYIVLEDMWITSKSANVGILMARDSSGGSAGCHVLRNVDFDGNFSLACVYSLASEVNRYYSCNFSNSYPGSYAFVFTGSNFANVESPYSSICQHGCNTEVRLIGCSFGSFQKEGGGAPVYICGWHEDMACNISIVDSVFSAKQQTLDASIIMDATGSWIENVRIDGVRFESNRTPYVILAKGHVLRVEISNSVMYWGGEQQKGAAIRYESHGSTARGWRIQQDIFNPFGGEKFGGDGVLYFDSVSDSVLEVTDVHRNLEKYLPALVKVDNSCQGSQIRVPSVDDVIFGSTPKRTVLETLNDHGIRRYFMGERGDVLLNLPMQDTAKIKNPRRGDVAVDDGTNTQSGQPTLAIYDLFRWVYLE